jgi:excisionase family DNA binding protein
MKAVGGIAPFGYNWQGGLLIIDEDEAPVRKLLYDLFLKHRRKKTVAKLLNELGYRTRSGSLFSDTTVDRLLRDMTAAGRRQVDGQTVEVEPIIPLQTWERVSNILDGNKPGKQSAHLFSGIAYCSCGGQMVVASDTKKYVCTACRHKILANDLQAIFHSQLIEAHERDDQGLYRNWQYFTDKEKRTVTEQLCNRIIVGRDTIHIEFCYSLPPAKTTDVAQQSNIRNETGELVPESATAPLIGEPLLSETEAARFLGISKMTVRRKRIAGQIGHFRVGHRILYSKEKHLISFLTKCEVD